jgi:hypothetical protein
MIANGSIRSIRVPPNGGCPHVRRRRWSSGLGLSLATCVGLSAIGAARADAAALPDTFLARVEALASMETLNAEILASRSATATLEAWCASHKLGATITATRGPGQDKPPTAAQRRRLDVGPDEPVVHRNVRLACGGHVLSEADNWYVPSRLTPAMNQQLETTDTPFGKVVVGLDPTRRTYAVTIVWNVLEPGWETRPPPPEHPGTSLAIPPILFEHHAVLFDSRQRPFSEVAEHYTRDILSFPPHAEAH